MAVRWGGFSIQPSGKQLRTEVRLALWLTDVQFKRLLNVVKKKKKRDGKGREGKGKTMGYLL